MGGLGTYKYEDVYSRLLLHGGIVVFFKKNGDVRAMLCTRNIAYAQQVNRYAGRALQAHDGKCNRSNGNIAVIDLELGEPRSFNISRLVSFTEVNLADRNIWNDALAQLKDLQSKFGEINASACDENQDGTEVKGEHINDLFASEPIA